jgi:hypothetical protein
VRIGFIYECGPRGADVDVCQNLAVRLKAGIECVARTLDNKQNLVRECGPVASLLLQECEHVLIIWDLFPPWRETAPCLHQDRMDIFESLDNAGVDQAKVSLVCIREELEAWLLADKRALQTVLAGMKHPHPLGTIKNYRNPDTIQKPKTRLTQLFQRELGRRRKYVDSRDAKRIVEAIPDFQKIRRSVSFQRFHDILTGL